MIGRKHARAISLHRLVLAFEKLDLLSQLIHALLLRTDRLELVLGRLEAVLGERHPFLLREIAIDEIVG